MQELEKKNVKEENNSFKVTDLSSANWCFKKILALQNKQKEIDKFVEKELKQVTDYHKKETEDITGRIGYFKMLLQQYVEEQEKTDPKFKLNVPYGTASFGKEQVNIQYDNDVMLEFVKNNNLSEFISTTVVEKLNKKDFNNYLSVTENGQVVTEDGEVLENAYAEIFRNFNVKVKEQEA